MKNKVKSGSPRITHLGKLEEGRQGITGIVDIDGVHTVYKISQFMNHLPDHEYVIMKGLNELSPYCPHFCRVFNKAKIPVHPCFRDHDQNPFQESSRAIPMDVLFMEYIRGSVPMIALLEDKSVPFDTLMACIKQVLLAVLVAQDAKRFTHYDLHAQNILIERCDPDAVHLYCLRGQPTFVATRGYVPVIIDFGFSRSDDIEGKPAYLSVSYTDAGYMAPAYDPLADFKVFLVSILQDFRETRKRDERTTLRLSRVVINLFLDLNLDWRRGWDKKRNPAVTDQIFEYVENDHEPSMLMRDYPHYCMDLFQSMITLPYRPKVRGSWREMRVAYQAIAADIFLLESSLQNLFYTLYMLRVVVDTARKIRVLYETEESRDRAVAYFQNELTSRVQTVAPFCVLEGIQYERLLCALYVFSDQLEYHLEELLDEEMHDKCREYSHLPVQDPATMVAILDVNFRDRYVFNDRSRVIVWDADSKSSSSMTITDEMAHALNATHPLQVAAVLYQWYREGGDARESDGSAPETEQHPAHPKKSSDKEQQHSALKSEEISEKGRSSMTIKDELAHLFDTTYPTGVDAAIYKLYEEKRKARDATCAVDDAAPAVPETEEDTQHPSHPEKSFEEILNPGESSDEEEQESTSEKSAQDDSAQESEEAEEVSEEETGRSSASGSELEELETPLI